MPRAISIRCGSPSASGVTRSAGRTSEVVTPISGRSSREAKDRRFIGPVGPAAGTTQVSLQPPPRELLTTISPARCA